MRRGHSASRDLLMLMQVANNAGTDWERRSTMARDFNDPVAFPTLTDAEMACLEERGEVRRFRDGETLFEVGEKNYSFFAIRSGSVAIIETSSGIPRDVVTHGPGSFTGDVDVLTGRPAVVSAVARGECEAVEINSIRIRRILGEVPTLSDKLLEAFQSRRRLLEASEFLGIRVIGAAGSRDVARLREFFYKNNVPHTFFDVETQDGMRLLEEFGAAPADTPVLACSEYVERKPALSRVAECLGISRRIRDDLYDVLIVGSGPAGLAAAVYGASEGLKTLIVDQVGPGGQAGQSSRIENYMGFPAGISGAELANRGYLQALKFGAEFTAPVSVLSMSCNDTGEYVLEFCTGQQVRTKSVLVATGASYRRLPVEGCEKFEGAGVYYSATTVEDRVCHGATAIVVGGGNSAGQAAMFLSQHAQLVKLLLRGDDLRKSMSNYLAERIENSPGIEVLRHTEVCQLSGNSRLESVGIRNNRTGETAHVDCPGLFIFVGAKPHTEWLPESVTLDEKGFVLTGPAIQSHETWSLDRAPCELETTCPGVFAAGDVRSGTTKRCAFAVGDGALAITCVHQFLSRER